jgi:GNAT superfamily N-acetyltransferase
MIIRTVPLRDLSSYEYKQCYSLNARQLGDMQDALARHRYSKRAIACLAKDENDILLGWALSFKGRNKQPDTHFYIRKTHRGHGIGTRLMREVLRTHNKIRVYPHNASSARFFCAFRPNIVTHRHLSWRIREATKSKN